MRHCDQLRSKTISTSVRLKFKQSLITSVALNEYLFDPRKQRIL